MFNKEILEPDGNIPKVYRQGLPKVKSESSLSEMMNQIEKEHTDEDLDVNDIMNRSLNDAASSVDSRMGDTPSNYNIPN